MQRPRGNRLHGRLHPANNSHVRNAFCLPCPFLSCFPEELDEEEARGRRGGDESHGILSFDSRTPLGDLLETAPLASLKLKIDPRERKNSLLSSKSSIGKALRQRKSRGGGGGEGRREEIKSAFRGTPRNYTESHGALDLIILTQLAA